MSKKLTSLILILGLGVLAGPLCVELCPSTHHGIGSVQSTECSFLSFLGVWVIALFGFILASPFLHVNFNFIPDGFSPPPFKPPRLYS